jgi:hypothetical protein
MLLTRLNYFIKIFGYENRSTLELGGQQCYVIGMQDPQEEGKDCKWLPSINGRVRHFENRTFHEGKVNNLSIKKEEG